MTNTTPVWKPAMIAILATCQPEDRGSTRVFTLITRAGPAGDAARLARFASAAGQVLREDLAALERRVMARAVYDQRHGV